MSDTAVSIGFIGLGVMGRSIAGRLMDSYSNMHIYSRRKESAALMLERGAQWHDSVAEIAEHCSVIFSMVGYPADVEEVYLGSDGLLKHVATGTLCIDMTTSKPQLAQKIYAEAAAKGIDVLDAPVSGGDIGAKNGTLSIMCGGDAEVFKRAESFFRCIGNVWTLQGGAGCGQHTKAANQIAVAANLVGVVESLRYAETMCLHPQQVVQTMRGGAAGSWQLTHNAPKMLEGDFAPGFFVKHFLKDLTIALDAAAELQLNLPFLRLAQHFFNEMTENGYANLGTQVLYDYYRKELQEQMQQS